VNFLCPLGVVFCAYALSAAMRYLQKRESQTPFLLVSIPVLLSDRLFDSSFASLRTESNFYPPSVQNTPS
jgi:hypothetical protein